jgi:uncharacterized protein (TIGR02246 family)
MSYVPYGNVVPSGGRSTDVISAIRDANQDFCTAFNTGNYDQCANLFTSDGCFMAPNQQTVQGNKAIERMLQKFGDMGYEDLRLETLRVDHSVDMAVEIGRYTVSIRQTNGTTVVDRGKYLNAWRRIGTWLKSADCWSSDLALMTRPASPSEQYRDPADPGMISPDASPRT